VTAAKTAKATEGVTQAAGRTKAFSGGITSAEETGGALGKFDRLAEAPSRASMAMRSKLGMSEYGFTGGIKARIAEKIIPNVEGVGTFKEAGTLVPDLEQAGGALKQAAYNAISPSTGTKPLVGGKYAENLWRVKKAEDIVQEPGNLQSYSKKAEFAANPEKAIAKKAWSEVTDPKHWWNQKMSTTQSALQQPGLDTRDASEATYTPGRSFNWGGNRQSYGSGIPWTSSHAEVGGVNFGANVQSLNRSLTYDTAPLFTLPSRTPKSTPQRPAADSAQVRGGRMTSEDIGRANEGIGKAWGFPKSNTGYPMTGGDIASANEGLATSSWGAPRSNTGYPMTSEDISSANTGIASAWPARSNTGYPQTTEEIGGINRNLSKQFGA
jgi:hypothetical protein